MTMNPYGGPSGPPWRPQAPFPQQRSYQAYDPELEKASKQLRTMSMVQMGFGGVGVLGAIQNLLPARAADPISDRVQEILRTGTFGTWIRVSTAIGILMALLLFWAGYSLYRRRVLGRTLTLAHGYAALVLGVISTVITMFLMNDAFGAMAGALPDPDMARVVIFSIKAMMIVGGLLGLILPIVELWMLSRPKHREVIDSFVD